MRGGMLVILASVLVTEAPAQDRGALPVPPAPRPAQRPAPDPAAPPPLVITPAQAAKVGRQIWLNESGGTREGVTAWNAGEDFPSLGIGHFIWFPAGTNPQFEETFPKVIAFMRRQKVQMPAWLDKSPVPPPPWANRQEFLRRFNAPETVALREFLLATIPAQAQFMAVRTQEALPKMLATLSEPALRKHVGRQFARVVRASPDLYPLIDYTNFKGEGTSEKETGFDKSTGRREGWGLKHILIEMKGVSDDPTVVLGEFADGARHVLKRRIRNLPAGARWEAGWMKRVETYRRPLR